MAKFLFGDLLLIYLIKEQYRWPENAVTPWVSFLLSKCSSQEVKGKWQFVYCLPCNFFKNMQRVCLRSFSTLCAFVLACLSECVYTGGLGWHCVFSSLTLHLVLCERIPHWIWELSGQWAMGDPLVSASSPCPHPQCKDGWEHTATLAFHCVGAGDPDSRFLF